MLNNGLIQNISGMFTLGFSLGISLGFIVWLISWCISQLMHFFKALTK